MYCRIHHLAILLIVLFSAPVFAASDAKSNPEIGLHPAVDHREGGETIADAIPILGTWNWSDTGATCDNLDDYDEACPYSGSTSPDVVYSFQYYGCQFIAFDLYGSTYDTKIFAYDEQMNLLACNDDYYPDYTSRLEYFSNYSGTMYIVVDGYGGDCGEYQIALEVFSPPPPYAVSCPAGALLEDEPMPVDGYVDQFNGGCDGAPAAFQVLTLAPGETELDFCGVLGWYETESVAHRDSDWFQVVATGDEITWTVDAQLSGTECLSAGPIDCSSPWEAQQEMSVGSGMVETMVIPTSPGNLVTLWIRPHLMEAPICEIDPYEYVFHLSGVSGTVAVDSETWGMIKTMYR